MKFIRSYRKRVMIFIAVCFTVMGLSYIRTITLVPGNITLFEGEEHVFNFKSPFLVNIKADKEGILQLNNNTITTTGGYVRLSSPITFKSNKKGSVRLNLKAFGFLPLPSMQVNVVSNHQIAACGNTVGVKLRLDGILVIALSDVDSMDGNKVYPTRNSGIKPGDMILEANREELKSIDNLLKVVERSKGNIVTLKYKHGSSIKEIDVQPVKGMDDKKYHLGLWVRDSTAGIGTLTFYDPKTRSFGALGHGITDIDTGTLMPVDQGDVLESNILAIKKGKPGAPGELKGVFVEDRSTLGTIQLNSNQGIYGTLTEESIKRLPTKLYSIGLRSEVREGPASILANINGKAVVEYSIDIQKVSRQNLNGSKGMVLKITDPKLLNETGGIVQGMSGSPILQNNKIIGAVTHVLVNDPSRGYGIFIESMLKNALEMTNNSLKKAS